MFLDRGDMLLEKLFPFLGIFAIDHAFVGGKIVPECKRPESSAEIDQFPFQGANAVSHIYLLNGHNQSRDIYVLILKEPVKLAEQTVREFHYKNYRR
jgi:hypothetical protein